MSISGVGVQGRAPKAPPNSRPELVGVGVEGLIGGANERVNADIANNPRQNTGVLGHSRIGVGVFGVSGDAANLDAVAGTGVIGVSTNGTGVVGKSRNSIGVHGKSGAPDDSGAGIGVKGESTDNVGVDGLSVSEAGVKGFSTDGPGIRAESTHGYGLEAVGNQKAAINARGNTVGIVARVERVGSAAIVAMSSEYSNHPDDSPGTFPQSPTAIHATTKNGQGIWTEATEGGHAMEAWSQAGVCIHAYSDTNIGIDANSQGFTALVATTNNQRFFAAELNGRLRVNGDMFTTHALGFTRGGFPDGTTRLVYAVGSPVSWIEDSGRATLTNGSAFVTLNNDFIQLISTDDYLVFLTPEDDCNGVFVSERNATGFQVRELQGGGSAARFSYRIIAKSNIQRQQRRLPIADAGVDP